MMRRIFTRHKLGGVEATMGAEEAGVLRGVALDLMSELDAPGENSVRWFPPAYSDDAERQDEFARMTRDDLMESKRAAIRSVVETIEGGQTKRGVWRATLSADAAAAWLGVLNDARLYLGTKLNVTEDLDHSPRAADEPDAPLHNLYLFLSALQGLLLDEMMDTSNAR